MSAPLGSEDYREGALSRLEDAFVLKAAGQWTGAIYMAGRAVEAMLRSLLWLRTRHTEEGHGLRELIRKVQTLDLVGQQEKAFIDGINEMAIVWHNNLRFVGPVRFLRDLRRIGRDKRVNGLRIRSDVLKANATFVMEVCEAVIARGDLIWKRSKTK